jgi:secreted trypsin-like serine protease
MGSGTDLAACRLSEPTQMYAAISDRDVESGETLIAVGFAEEPHRQDLRTWQGTVIVNKTELEVAVPRDAVCRGDSGGPGFLLQGGTLKLAAVASSRPLGRTCHDDSRVNYTNLSRLHSWLNTTLVE